MSLTATVTKKSVTFVQQGMHAITFNLKVSDGVSNVVDADVSCEFRTGDNPASKVVEVKDKMQAIINNYKSAQVIFNSAAIDTAVTNINGGLST